MDGRDEYFWCKNGRPSIEKDRLRHAVARLYLCRLKTQATVMKSIHVATEEGFEFRSGDDVDISPYLYYSLNKKRRWEDEAEIGVELLERARNLNAGWKTIFLERVNLKSYLWDHWSYWCSPERFCDSFRIRGVHKLTEENVYEHCCLNSVFGQRYSNFLEENRKPKKEKKKGKAEEEVEEKVAEPLMAYNFLRAPKNYLTLLSKQYTSSNYGWDWPHVGYWRRVDLQKEHNLELRYGKIEDSDGDPDDLFCYDFPSDFEQKPMEKCYNLEDHIVDKFMIVKRHKKRKNEKTGFEIL
ncbi:unnamed protein product [Caenorhabditis sp. 36 PRJEB53466]|nr:unnamed protein product [Caenorhabditis sp. 36 PRJEB53466]